MGYISLNFVIKYIKKHYDILFLGILVMVSINYFIGKMGIWESLWKGILLGLLWAIIILSVLYILKKPIRKIF